MYKWIRQQASWKKTALIFITAQIIFLCMNTLTFPAIMKDGSGLIPFDMTGISGYDYQYADSFINELTLNGRTVYLFFQEPLDILYPLLISFSFVMAFCLLSKEKSRWPLIGFIPMIFDYLENILVISMLTVKPLPLFLPSVSSSITWLKAVSSMLCMGLLIIVSLWYFTGWIIQRRKQKYGNK
ncbi:hypothetical protein EDD76_11041 [Kineothrix alysoides]|uniref:Uncharacterized protein n=1 Tax=Kineothrix alysoides TaxID=1469948 RepID=A0A4R1QSJ2_9FIRM|nr:hypothetical protein [Kineothrix alysoides]TCL56869.1 hypothetical protein EDD76_11041 [Kineothrix alysoides]